jgi:RimJ/RimL family protein N-acetyltransferase
MPWAQAAPALDESQVYCRRMQARFLLREDLLMSVFERDAQGREARLVASTGLHRMDWTVRSFEIGYWRRIGHGGRGLVAEAVSALARMAFDRLGAHRVEIRMDDSNHASWAMAEGAGFTLEALLRNDCLAAQGAPRSTRVYARVRGVEEPRSSVDN